MSIFMPRCLDLMNMMNFKIQAFFTTLIIGTVSALTISGAISQKVNAQAAPSCNNATIKGSYGIKFTGTFPGKPIAEVGFYKFNGTGNFQGTVTQSTNGTVSTNTEVSGLYSVKQDCTVLIFGDGSLSGIIVDGGKEIFIIQTDPGSLITATFKKVN
ncbi:MAG: hypothetical protein V7K32_00745 [Nostoc sp.]|uniref:hypothetical protein n=1 Tax=Nostoc sp. TaxID=1180 RepID=UPI002FFB831E